LLGKGWGGFGCIRGGLVVALIGILGAIEEAFSRGKTLLDALVSTDALLLLDVSDETYSLLLVVTGVGKPSIVEVSGGSSEVDISSRMNVAF
jgi:hypothetical protein